MSEMLDDDERLKRAIIDLKGAYTRFRQALCSANAAFPSEEAHLFRPDPTEVLPPAQFVMADKKRRVTSTGIRWTKDGVTRVYYSPAFHLLRGREVFFWYNPEALDVVWVVDAGSGALIGEAVLHQNAND